MNSKIFYEKIQQIEDEAIEMRLLKRSEKNHEIAEEKDQPVTEYPSQSTVSLKHYDQVSSL